jgi:hypothetical protein
MVMQKLSPAQDRVMRLMSKKWIAHQAHGSTVQINGIRVCNIDTMGALKRKGLVESESLRSWKATNIGLDWKA